MANHQEIHLEKKITIHSTTKHLFKMWRNVENLPYILDFLEEVKALDENRSKWSLLTVHNERIVFEIEITEEAQGKFITWHSQKSTDLLHEGTVSFSSTAEPRTTQLELSLHFYFPPMEESRSEMLGENLEARIEEDLQRFKVAIQANQFPKKREGTSRYENLPDSVRTKRREFL
ncbi:SRPBCC family protein [Chitinispirillales bacterium ANBcel5]|uniref:SRPBCC family protein n=1 Tax=Cellulosispirillum alkaliphilum TaxID=3039283 RepID=UPI002A5918A0|nr:SRPBCC family protein [Chitinispirillales bacterium ANBcel5]